MTSEPGNQGRERGPLGKKEMGDAVKDDARITGSGSGTGGGDPPRAVALVILRSPAATPRDIDLTAATIAGYLPDPATAADASSRLTHAGFRVGPVLGTSFAIEGSSDQFRSLFGVAPMRAADGGWTTEQGDDELPLEALPEPLRTRIAAVVFERPVELHDRWA